MLKLLLHLLLPVRDEQASELHHKPRNRTSLIESVGLQGHDTSPSPNASQVGMYSEQDELATETQFLELRSTDKSMRTAHSDLHTWLNDRPHMGTLQTIRDVYHTALDHGLIPK